MSDIWKIHRAFKELGGLIRGLHWKRESVATALNGVRVEGLRNLTVARSCGAEQIRYVWTELTLNLRLGGISLF